jgi:hypothetical protein
MSKIYENRKINLICILVIFLCSRRSKTMPHELARNQQWDKVKRCTKNKMFTTEFLSSKHHYLYGDWLKSQDDETRHLYFGLATGPGLIESLVERIEAQPDRHEILVARNCTEWLGTLHIAKMSDLK